MKDLFSLKNKIALLTGASYGIGLAIGKAFGNAGAGIIFSDINSELVKRGLYSYKEAGIDAFGYICDITDEKSVHEMRKRIEDEIGNVDILVNNAAIIKHMPLIETSASNFRQVIDIDLNAPFIVSKEFLSGMIKYGGGKIINLCSLIGERAYENTAAYSAAKGGLKMLTRSICAEYARYNIQCNGLAPGYIRTSDTVSESGKNGYPADSTDSSDMITRTPARRWGKGEDLCGPAVFLASEASDFVNGQILYVDGGVLSYLPGKNGEGIKSQDREFQ